MQAREGAGRLGHGERVEAGWAAAGIRERELGIGRLEFGPNQILEVFILPTLFLRHSNSNSICISDLVI